MKNLFIVLCVSMPMLVIAEVFSDPYGYWHTDLTDHERYELDMLLDEYYSNYLNEAPKRNKTSTEKLTEEECYSNYLEEIRMNLD